MVLYLRLLLLICCIASTAVGAPKTKVRLILPVETARPGDTFLAGVQLTMPGNWDTYWRNPGESGGATEIQWELPEGISAGPIQWPVPEKYLFSELTTYVYHKEAVLLVPLTIAPTVKAGPAQLKANVSWLECEELCVPGSGNIQATLNIGRESKESADAALIEAAKTKLPRDSKPVNPRAWWEKAANGDSRTIILEWSSKADPANADFYPYENPALEVAPKVESIGTDPGKIRIRKQVKKSEGDWPKQISGVLVENVSSGMDASGYEAILPITDEASAEVPAKRSGSSTAPLVDGSAQPLWKMLIYAFIGGLILNVMPCVLPVIALKIFGFVQQSHDDPRRTFRLGLVYGTGVLASFLLLAGVVIAAKSATGGASWGIHMQNPYFRLSMTVLMLLVSLNLFGLFEITLGGRAMGTATDLASRHGAAGAFFNGILAVALASSCTAPFLATAVGYAIAQSPAVIVLFFLTIGAGLAFPYLLLSWRPQWLKFLPKPGAWMERFKVALGFPVLATAFWLFSVTTPSFGEDGTWGFAVFLVALSVAAWIWGEFVQRGRTRKGLAIAFAIAVLAFGYLYGLEDQMEWRTLPTKSATSSGVVVSKGIEWHPWSVAAIESARDEGHPVLVDFTAAWCPNCKANKRRAIDIDSVRSKLKQTGTIAMIADFTDRNATIAAELQKFGQSGVPLVLVYPRDKTKPPLVLPNWLTESIVLDALDQASK